jgi:hypothetical protein
MPISNAVTQFRQDVIKKGGPQIASKYEVTLFRSTGSPPVIKCYPLSVVLPGRIFSLYEHDLWGPVRKIPYKRGYTQCNMTFLIYQDWEERKFIESWMNNIVKNIDTSSSSSSSLPDYSSGNVSQGTANLSEEEISDQANSQNDQASNSLFKLGSSTNSQTSNVYKDYVNYINGTGRILIEPLESNSSKRTCALILKEAYPATLSPTTFAADGTGYASFTVGFQFNDYIFN